LTIELNKLKIRFATEVGRVAKRRVDQRVEPAKKAAQILHKKLLGCVQSQTGVDAERRMVTANQTHCRNDKGLVIIK
uniref:Uncharacterized protein n=1 Tax=Periophthalmus magnuspinnatus TaxID=409849 RepID=A0A3B3ZKT4_9GOBI